MTARFEVLQAIADDDGHTLSKNAIQEEVDSGARDVDAALRGLVSEDVVVQHRVLGDSYYSVAPNADKRDLEQAMRRQGASEIAEDIIQKSGMLGDPGDAEKERGEIFKHLF